MPTATVPPARPYRFADGRHRRRLEEAVREALAQRPRASWTNRDVALVERAAGYVRRARQSFH